MKELLSTGLLLAAVISAASAVADSDNVNACAPLDKDYEELASWRKDGFPVAEPDTTVLDLVPCLAEVDPFLRDRIGYEGLSTILRSAAVSAGTRERLLQLLTAILGVEDDVGVAAPFAALALSEVVRTDRIDPFLNATGRATVVDLAADYLTDVDDYRGLVDGEGWRHGVAHGADLVLQLVLNPAVTDAQAKHLSRAVFSQVNARGGHSYIFGEAGRLARPVLYAALRDGIESEHWQQLFAELADPGELGQWSAAFESETGMARLHNTRGFAQAIFVTASASGRTELDAIVAAAEILLQSLP